MKLYNKGGRALILPPEEVISGGRYQDHDRKKTKCYFDPSKSIEVKDEYGAKILGMYTEMLVKMDSDVVPKAKVAKKKAKKKITKG
jgi:hypothetical protein